jgi:tetrahydromethanopterin S-methyltransferase subunit B
MAPKHKNPDMQNVMASVPLPSADLITYRFDQIDTALGKLDEKMEKMTNTHVTRAEFITSVDEITKHFDKLDVVADALKEESDQAKGAIRLLKGVIAFLAALAAILGALWWVRP